MSTHTQSSQPQQLLDPDSADTTRMSVAEATALGERALRALGYPDDEARVIVDQLIDNALCGYKFAGLPRILAIADDAKTRNARSPVRIVHETPVSALLDGGNNVGSWGTGNVYDNNCFGAEFTDFIVWGSTLHDTYDAWEADHGEAWAQVESDPSFTDDTSDDYTLASDSPCIGGGDDLGAPYNVGLMPASTWPSGVVTDDRGDY